jgi:hypothetical protein
VAGGDVLDRIERDPNASERLEAERKAADVVDRAFCTDFIESWARRNAA